MGEFYAGATFRWRLGDFREKFSIEVDFRHDLENDQ